MKAIGDLRLRIDAKMTNNQARLMSEMAKGQGDLMHV